MVLPESPERVEHQVEWFPFNACGDGANAIYLVGFDIAQEQQGQMQVFLGHGAPACLIQVFLQLAQLLAHGPIGQQCEKQSLR